METRQELLLIYRQYRTALPTKQTADAAFLNHDPLPQMTNAEARHKAMGIVRKTEQALHHTWQTSKARHSARLPWARCQQATVHSVVDR